VQLPQIQLVLLQTPEAHEHALLQVLGSPHRQPHIRPVADEAALGRDDHATRIGREDLREQFLAHECAVAVGRVDEVDAQLWNPPDGSHGLRAVYRRPPWPRPALSATNQLQM